MPRGRPRRPWRLPGELEWEKAARGVDGRRYPWGDAVDPSWCFVRASWDGRVTEGLGPQGVDSHPVDVSVYGVRGLGGNVRDWCLDGAGQVAGDAVSAPEEGDLSGRVQRVVRGGSWVLGATYAGSAQRTLIDAGMRTSSIGFRTMYRWPGD